MNGAKLSIVIVNYKGKAYLNDCLSSIFSQEGVEDFEVIVVDNASNDGSAELIRSDFPTVRLLRNKYNYGFAIANNQGFEVSTGEYVMTLNPDAEIVGKCLGSAIQLLDRDPKIGILAPSLKNGDAITAVYDGYHLISPIRLFKRLGLARGSSQHEIRELKIVNWIWGTGYICRRSALGERFFDESTFLFAEEQEICERVRKNGFSIALSPDFVISHVSQVSYGRDIEKSALARRLLEASCWLHRRRMLGLFLADLHQFVRGADDLVMLAALWIKNRFSERNGGRDLEMANLEANVRASLGLIARGEKYFDQVNKEARVYFNEGTDIPFPPETIK